MGKKFTKNHALIYTKEFQSHFFLGIDALRNEESEKAKSAFKNEIKVIENLKEKIKKYDESPARNGCLKILEIAGKNAYGFLELIDFDDQWVLINKVNTLKQLNTIVTAIQSFLINAKIFNNPLDIPEFNLRWISYSKLLVFNFLYSALSSRKADFDSLDEARKWFRELKLTGFKQGVDAVENFAMTLIKEKNFDNIPQEKENRLLGLLRPVYVLGRESSLLVAMKQDNTRFMKQIRDLVKKEIREGLGSRAGKSKILKESKPEEPAGQKAEYEIWLPHPEIEGWTKHYDNIFYNEFKTDYLDKISKYELFVDETKGQVFFKGKEAKEKLKNKTEVPSIRDIPFKILCRFLRKGGIAGAVEYIFSDVWGENPDLFTKFENRIEQAIKTLRKRLKEIELGIEFLNGKYRLSRFVNYCLVKEKEIHKKRKSK